MHVVCKERLSGMLASLKQCEAGHLPSALFTFSTLKKQKWKYRGFVTLRTMFFKKVVKP